MKNQKAMPAGRQGFAPIIIILVVLLGIAGVYYFSTLKPKTVTLNPTPIVSSLPSSVATSKSATLDPTSNWEIYVNNENGYSIKFPKTEYTRLGCISEELTAAKYGTTNRPSPMTMIACERDSRYDLESKTYPTILSDPSKAEYSGYDIIGSDIEMDGVKARLYVYTYTSNEERGPLPSGYALARVTKDNKTYEIFFGDKQKLDLFNQILSTFKFTN